MSLAAGFTPDPADFAIFAGGGVDASYLGPACFGFGGVAPDIRLQWDGTGGFLRIYFIPDQFADAAMVVNDPTGQWLCNDDAFGLDPGIDWASAPSGIYDIWVTSLAADELPDGTLSITELTINP